MVDGVLLAIGGSEKQDLYSSEKTSAIYAFHHVDQKWQHVGDMPFQCSMVDSLLLSEGRLLVVDGDNQQVLKITVDPAASGTVLTRVISDLAKSLMNEADERCVG